LTREKNFLVERSQTLSREKHIKVQKRGEGISSKNQTKHIFWGFFKDVIRQKKKRQVSQEKKGNTFIRHPSLGWESKELPLIIQKTAKGFLIKPRNNAP